MSRSIVASRTFVVLLIAAAFARAGGQRPGVAIRGTVADSANGQPIPGVVILALDSAGATLGRAISNARGEYGVAVAAGGRSVRAIRVLRIGFRPRQVPLAAAMNDVARVDIRMVELPMLLEAVGDTAAARCPRRANQTAALALWQQVRTGLLATVVSQDVNPPRVTRLHFDRRMDGNSETIESQTVTIDSLAQARPFAAVRSAADFAQYGFSGNNNTFFGPDAQVLLDEAFARTYCFSLADPERNRPHQVGLAFAAADQRDGRVDIEGALWIDTLARRLSDIEFHYVGLPRAIDRFHPGGRIAFHEMPNGSVLIDYWYLRLVNARPDTTHETYGLTGELRPVVSNTFWVEEVGGRVARAAWRDGVRWQAPLGTLRGLLMEDGTVAGAARHVSLAGTPYAAVTDSSGTFEIADLLPGPYRLNVSSAELAADGIVQDSSATFAAAPDTVGARRFTVASLDDYMARECRIPLATARQAQVVVGKVRTPYGGLVGDAIVSLAMTPPPAAGAMSTRYVTGTNGEFAICHPPFDGTLSVSVSLGGQRVGRVIGSAERRKRVATADVVADGSTRAVAGAGRTVTGIVYDSLLNAPLAGVAVSADGGGRAVTDTAGRFALRVGYGLHTLTASVPALDSLRLAPRREVDVEDSMPPVRLATPSLSTLERGACGDSSALVTGRVRDAATGAPLPGSAVELRWLSIAFTDGHLRASNKAVEASADSEGVYTSCVPERAEPTAVALIGERHTGDVDVTVGPRRIASLDLFVGRASTDGGAAPSIVLHGIVSDSLGRPLADAIVTSVATDSAAHTGADGRYTLRVPEGSSSIDARHVGYAPARFAVVTRPGRDNARDVQFVRVAQLASVLVNAAATASAQVAAHLRAAFEQRRALGMGSFITPEDLARTPFPLLSLLEALPRLNVVFKNNPDMMDSVVCAGYVCKLAASHGAATRVALWDTGNLAAGHGNACKANLYIDGRAEEDPDMLLSMLHDEVAAVEYYAFADQAPNEYVRLTNGCGVLLVWTVGSGMQGSPPP